MRKEVFPRGWQKGYAVVMTGADGKYAAYVPDLPGCVSTGGTLDEAQQSIREKPSDCISMA